MEEEPKVAKGFDRDVDYRTMKKRLLRRLNKNLEEYNSLTIDLKNYSSKKRILINKIIYLLVSIIQLRNGARISEAVSGFIKFIKSGDFENKVTVKIAKSASIKYRKDTKEKYKTKERYRKIMFPNNWFEIDASLEKDLRSNIKNKSNIRIQKNVLDYLLNYFNCNTHSLRYAFINYMLYDQKKEMAVIAKFVGHVNVNQLVTYTQNKNTDKIFDMDI